MNRYWKDEDEIVAGDALHDARSGRHYLLTKPLQTSLSDWFALCIETGGTVILTGVGRCIHESNGHYKRI